LHDFFNYVKKHPDVLAKNTTIKDTNYTLRLCTPELLLSNEEKSLEDRVVLKQKLDSLSGSINFVFIISDASIEGRLSSLLKDKDAYSSLLFNSNNQLTKSFVLKTNSGEVPCSLCHLEAASSNKPEIRISLMFPVAFHNLINTNDDFTLRFDDFIMQNGTINFNYSNIKNELPQLIL
jgi:hypothetical protein